MQKAIRNSGKGPVSVESLDKREDARQRDSQRPVIKSAPVATDSKAKANAAADKLDRDYQANKAAQERAKSKLDANEFNVRQDG